ncbi:MAG: hypothetical protein ACREMR_02425 [Gemmatimonadales bacterium]
MMARRGIAVVLLTTSLAACTTWRRSVDVFTQPVPERAALQLWRARESHWVHGVAVRGDSIPAVPRWKPPPCDSCAVFFALAEVDSVRVRVPSTPRTVALATFLAGVLFLAVWLSGFESS